MKKYFLLAFVFGLFACGIAEAGTWDKIKGFFNDQNLGAIAVLITLVLGYVQKKLGTAYDKTATTLKETGKAIKTLGDGVERLGGAIQDGKIETSELQNGIEIVKQVKSDIGDVVDVAKETPVKYKVE